MHGSVLTLFLVFQNAFFLGTGIGLQVPQGKACSLPKKTNEAVVLSLPFPSFSVLSSCSLQQQLFTSTVFVLLLSKQTQACWERCIITRDGVLCFSSFGQTRSASCSQSGDLWEGISCLYLFPLKVH